MELKKDIGLGINGFTRGYFENNNKKYTVSQNFAISKIFSDLTLSLDSHNSHP